MRENLKVRNIKVQPDREQHSQRVLIPPGNAEQIIGYAFIIRRL
jgi:hypothetical protein